MAIIRCKMCGADITLSADKTFGTCESCGTTMTFPKVSDDQRAAAFNRGNHFRRIGDFDKALTVYERIVAEDNTDAEAHWCCALCRFGIEYVEDPESYEWQPTCHRASLDNFLEDVDYLAAVEYSDGLTRRQYQKDGRKIADVQRGILATSQNEKPYDVFLCYKESDEDGSRTVDSTLAQEIYYQLTEQGRRVFFARITLEGKPGAQYEPYIFAALNSARVMVVVGTTPAHFNAVWVKNEWSRFLSLMKKDHSKLLLPCYRDMDPYDLPEQLSVLQSYDMSKIGFLQDLIRGVGKVLDADKKVQPPVVVNQSIGGPNVTALLKRGQQALEDKDWEKADAFFDQALNMDAESAEAFLGKALCDFKVESLETLTSLCCADPEKAQPELCQAGQPDIDREAALVQQYTVPGYLKAAELQKLLPFDFGYLSLCHGFKDYRNAVYNTFSENRNFQRALRYASGPFKKQLDTMLAVIDQSYQDAIVSESMKDAIRVQELLEQYTQHLTDTEAKMQKMQKKALDKQEADKKHAAEEERKQRELHEERQRAEAVRKRRKRITILVAGAVVCSLCAYLVLAKIVIPDYRYQSAETLLARGNYDEAAAAFEALGDYRDSADRQHYAAQGSLYQQAASLLASGNFDEAAKTFQFLGDYRDSRDQYHIAAKEAYRIKQQESYQAAEALLNAGKYSEAAAAFSALGDYQDSAERAKQIHYSMAEALLAEGRYGEAEAAFAALGKFQDSAERVLEVRYAQAEAFLTAGSYNDAIIMFRELGNYADSADRADRAKELAYSYAESLLEAGDPIRAAMTFGQLGNYRDARIRSLALWDSCAQRVSISGGNKHTVGLRADGTVVAVGDDGSGQCRVFAWDDITAVAAGYSHTVGLKADGTVKAVGTNYYGQCDVSAWKDIIAVAAGSGHTVGLRADGTVVTAGSNSNGQCDVSAWKDIVAVAAGDSHTVGLRADGTVVAVGWNGAGQCDVSAWKDIIAVAAGSGHTVGLRADGTVVTAGSNSNGQCDVSAWKDIVAVAAGSSHTIGLKADGTVVAAGSNSDGECDVSVWKNIVAVAAGNSHTVGLKTAGLVVAVGSNGEDQCEVFSWKNIRIPVKGRR